MYSHGVTIQNQMVSQSWGTNYKINVEKANKYYIFPSSIHNLFLYRQIFVNYFLQLENDRCFFGFEKTSDWLAIGALLGSY